MRRAVEPFRSTHRHALVLACLCALAQVLATRDAAAQTRRGGLIVLGLRAPNGDDEAAGNMTNALRRAARDAGFDVPDNSPALEQSMAAFGCDESVPVDCLAQIAGDLHAQRMLYGDVRHHGRGAAATLEIHVTLYDNASHTTAGHDSATAPRAMGQDNEALSPMAHRMVEAVLPPPPPTPVPDPTQLQQSHQPAPVAPAPSGPSAPVRRYVGIGLMVVGVVGGAVGMLATGIPWLGTNSHVNDRTGLSGDVIPGSGMSGDAQSRWLWQTYMNQSTSGDQVCGAANQSTMSASLTGAPTMNQAVATTDGASIQNWQLANARQICSMQTGRLVTEFAFLAGGAALTLVGLVLAVTDHSDARPASDTHARRRAPLNVAVVPTLSPGYSGAMMSLQF